MPTPRTEPQQFPATALWVAGGVVLAAILFGQVPGHGRWAAELGNSAHGPAFAVITLILIALLRRVPGRNAGVLRDYSLAIALALLLGAALELMQLATGRDASFSDLQRDALGAFAATGFYSLVDPHVRALSSRRPARFIGLLVGVASLSLIVAPLLTTGAAYLQRHRSFPTLVEFGSATSTYFLGAYSAVTIEREALPSSLADGRRGSIGLHARLAGNKGWALALWEPYPDWRGYQHLAIDVANPTDVPLRLQVRVRDRSQGKDRQAGYRGQIEIAPRSRETCVIALREMTAAKGRAYVNLARVNAVVLTRTPSNRAREFYLMRIGLE